MNYMKVNEKIKKLEEITKRIEDCQSATAGSLCPYELYRYENIILQNIKTAVDLLKEIKPERQSKVFTKEELSDFDGTNGKPAYVAVNGIVYDVSLEPTWGGASHFGLLAGTDVTEQFNRCHGNLQVLSKLPKAGELK